MVEAVALGDGAGELVLADAARVEEHLLGADAGRTALLDGEVGVHAGDEAQLDEHVEDVAAGAAAARRRRDAVPGRGRGVVDGLQVHEALTSWSS